MGKRVAGSIAVLLGAVLMVTAVLDLSWWKVRPRAELNVALRSIGPRSYDRLTNDVSAPARGTIIVVCFAAPLCAAAGVMGLRRRMPFLLAALASVSAGAFSLMALIFQIEMPPSLRADYAMSAGLPIALIGGFLGAVGSWLLASWSWTPDARGVS